MNKKILILTLALSLLIGMFVFSGAEDEYNVSLSDPVVSKDGKVIEEITEGELTAEVEIKCNEGAVSPLIVAMLCEGTRDSYMVRELKKDDSVIVSKDSPKKACFTFNCTDSKNKFIKILAQESPITAKRAAKDVFFPNGEVVKLKDIKINGNSIPGFSKDVYSYEYKLPMGEGLPVSVTAEKLFDGAEISISEITELPGEITVTSSYKDYEPAVYKIKVKESGPEVKLISVSNRSTNPSGYRVIENIDLGTEVHTDNPRPISDFGKSGLQGSTVIQTVFIDGVDNGANPNGFYPYEDFITFSINKSAEVYVGSYMKDVKAGDKFLDWASEFGELVKDNEEEVIMVAGGKNIWLYKHTYTVPVGETEEITLKNIGKYGNGMYVIFVKWTEE